MEKKLISGMHDKIEKPQKLLPKEEKRKRLRHKGDVEVGRQITEVVDELRRIIHQRSSKAGEYISKYGRENLRNLLKVLKPYEKEEDDRDLREETTDPTFVLRLKGEADKNPELRKIYTNILADLKKENEQKVKNILESGIGGEIDRELLSYLKEHTYNIKNSVTREQAERLRGDFPQGNYLYYGAYAEDMIKIIGSGQIMSADEIKAQTSEQVSRGGQGAPCFSLNEIKLMPGTSAHIMGVLISPEAVLDENRQLQVPDYRAAISEVRLHVRPDIQKESEKKLYARADIEKGYAVVSRSDVDAVQKIMASNGVRVRGILVFSPVEIREPSFPEYTGDHKQLSVNLENMFSQAGIESTLKWEDLLPGEVNMWGVRFVHSESTRGSECLVMEGGVVQKKKCEKAKERLPRRDAYDGLQG